IGGEGLARGYWGQEELTAERFVASRLDPGGRLYRTGDRVRWRADGQLEFLGRADDQVKVRGFRIELGEVEAVLAACPGVRAARRLAGYLVPADPAAGLPPVSAIRAYLRARLPAFMVPGVFTELPEL